MVVIKAIDEQIEVLNLWVKNLEEEAARFSCTFQSQFISFQFDLFV